jgi:hypothetical protein
MSTISNYENNGNGSRNKEASTFTVSASGVYSVRIQGARGGNSFSFFDKKNGGGGAILQAQFKFNQ